MRNGNQFVWVPCTVKENQEITKFQKRDFILFPNVYKDNCFDENYKNVLKSVIENGGFYISRYEIGNEDNEPVSKKSVKVWNEINREEAIQISNKMYEELNINCELINGYCYDTVLNWIQNTNKISNNILDLENADSVILTGRMEYNNVFDLFDNVMEFTSETFYETVVIRGVGSEDIKKENSRYVVMDLDKSFAPNTTIGFRTVLYK